MTAQPKKIAQLEKILDFFFARKEILERALTHRSHAYEKHPVEPLDNETLEFLGDSVVGLIVADFFYSNYNDMSEGELSKLKSSAANTNALSDLARCFLAVELGSVQRRGGAHVDALPAVAFHGRVGDVVPDGLQALSCGDKPPLAQLDGRSGRQH